MHCTASARIQIAIVLLLSGCAFTPKAPEERGGNLVSGTRILAEVAGVYTRDEILNPSRDQKAPHKWYTAGWYTKLLEAGYKDSDVVDGSEVSAETSCYAHNARVGCRHISWYMAHVGSELRGQLRPAQTYGRGDIVEIELRTTPSNKLVGLVTRVHRNHDDWRDCQIRGLETSALFLLSPMGPPVGRWLDCADLENEEGWARVHVPGAPLAGVYEWRKLPPTK